MNMISLKHFGILTTLALLLLVGCVTPQVNTSNRFLDNGLAKGSLQASGIAFITPSTFTGQEEDKQALALVFSDTLHEMRPQLHSVNLAETLTAINQSGLATQYQKMYENYRQTGIFKKEVLKKISQITNTRYLAQLKLEGFRQDSTERWGILGLRALETKSANIRIFLQIWDGQEGAIVWEGSEELNYSHDVVTGGAVPFKKVAEDAARNLLSHLP